MFADELSLFRNNIAAINSFGERLLYTELISRADEFGIGLGHPRQLVALECRNDFDTLIRYVGCLRHRHVVMLLPQGGGDQFYNELNLTFKPSVICRYRLDASQVVRMHDETLHLHDDLAILLTTSGSTGASKYVRLSYDNLDANAHSIGTYLGIVDTDKPITTLPFQYSYGLSIINSHLMKGASMVVTELTLFDREFWNLFKGESVTTFGGVPYTYEMLNKLRFERMKLPSLKYITQAGGRLSPDQVSKMAELAGQWGIRFLVMYGQTEATARISYLPYDKVRTNPSSIGISIPGGELSIVDPEGHSVFEAYEKGELVYSGPNVMMGYASKIDDLAMASEGNVLKTGDIGYFDDDGLFYISGRKSRFIKVYGVRLDLDGLEQQLIACGYDVICTGTDNNLKVVTESSGLYDDIKSCLTSKFGLKEHCIEVKVISTIPRSSSGKINYDAL